MTLEKSRWKCKQSPLEIGSIIRMKRILLKIGVAACLGVTFVVLGGETSRSLVGWDEFSTWHFESEGNDDARRWMSPWVRTERPIREAVLSWNVNSNAPSSLDCEIEVRNDARERAIFTMGIWGRGPNHPARTSVNRQSSSIGRVSTDTLVLEKGVREFRVRLRGASSTWSMDSVNLIAVALIYRGGTTRGRVSNREVWGSELAVPQVCQLDYPGGNVWCSPTSLGMALTHWVNRNEMRPLGSTLPAWARQVFDPGWGGTGNWAFNTAFAGDFLGIRSYVVRLRDVVDLEVLLSAGIPVPVSVSYNRLKGLPRRSGDGHFVVCVGVAETGDLVVNDPARQPEVRWVYDRDDFIAAWATSKNTAYLIYPDRHALPPDPEGQWTLAVH